jgi:carboxyl-terminal processing protease
MNRFFRCTCCFFAFVFLPALSWGREEATIPDVDPQSKEAARRTWTVIEAVLDNHVAPPTRQQMVLSAVSDLWTYTRKNEPLDRQTARRISELTEQSEIEALLSEQLSSASQASGKSVPHLETLLIHSALRPVRGESQYMSAKESVVQQQLLANRYVGIGIQMGVKDGYPAMMKLFHRGPAQREGGQEGDLMVSIDGADTKGKRIEEVVSVLRGQAGTSVSIVVRQPDSQETRTLKIVRGEVPMETVVGRERADEDHWNYAILGAQDVAYIKIQSIRGSTVSELRETARKLKAENFRAVILDLRRTDSGELRHVVMMADLLLEAAPIGSAVIRGRREEFTSNEESLFPGWPMAVLVNGNTDGQAEWLAASLKQRRDTTLMGANTPGLAYVTEHIQLADGAGLRLQTGIFHRPDGRSLVTRNLDESQMTIRRLTQELQHRTALTGAYAEKAGTEKENSPQPVDEYWNGVAPDVVTSGDPVVAAATKLSEQLVAKVEVGK